MKKYRIDRIRRCGLYRLEEKRRIKGKWEWICIGILTGSRNADRLEGRLKVLWTICALAWLYAGYMWAYRWGWL